MGLENVGHYPSWDVQTVWDCFLSEQHEIIQIERQRSCPQISIRFSTVAAIFCSLSKGFVNESGWYYMQSG